MVGAGRARGVLAEADEKKLVRSLIEVPRLMAEVLRLEPKIEELARGDKNALVIVGVAHLVGNDGVVELLRSKGLKVTQE